MTNPHMKLAKIKQGMDEHDTTRKALNMEDDEEWKEELITPEVVDDVPLSGANA